MTHEIRTIEQQWQEFAIRILAPKGIGRTSTQYIETRRGFYAGFNACLETLSSDLPEHPDEVGMKAISGLWDQITVYAQDLRDGKA